MNVKWDEPLEFSRAFAQDGYSADTQEPVLAGIITAAAVALIIPAFELFFYLLHKKSLGVPVYFYFVVPAVAGIFVRFLPSMVSSIPSKIILTEKGIHRNKAIGTVLSLQFWPWESISGLAIEDVQYGAGTYRVLVVRSDLEQGEILIGLGDGHWTGSTS